jgi:RecB family exonuclease
MSASALERFWGCPFSFLLSDILGIEEGEFDFSFSDPLVFGQLQHDALRLLMSPAEGQGGTDGRNGGGGRSEAGGRDAAAGSNRSEANGQWKAGADHGEAAGSNDPDLEAAWRAVSRAFDAWERSGRPLFPPPVWRSFRERAAERAAAFLRRDREEFAGYETAYVERWVDWVDEETGILLTGRIDRIARKDDRYHLIDYKNSGYVSKGNVAVEPGATGSYQIPFYTLLCRNSGIDVEGASYYILSEGKFSRFFGAEDGKAWFSRGETLALAENVRAAAALMAGRIAEGDYGATAGDLCGDAGSESSAEIRIHQVGYERRRDTKQEEAGRIPTWLDPTSGGYFRSENIVVSAGAGSGKTRVRAYRVCNLVLSGKAEVDGSLTLTFTRKAASEMYERIYTLLRREAERGSEPARRGIEDFERAQISTIDSFCAQIALTVSYGTDPPRFRSDEEA